MIERVSRSGRTEIGSPKIDSRKRPNDPSDRGRSGDAGDAFREPRESNDASRLSRSSLPSLINSRSARQSDANRPRSLLPSRSQCRYPIAIKALVLSAAIRENSVIEITRTRRGREPSRTPRRVQTPASIYRRVAYAKRPLIFDSRPSGEGAKIARESRHTNRCGIRRASSRTRPTLRLAALGQNMHEIASATQREALF